jgi:hydrogenase/urease accessory protein HupE
MNRFCAVLWICLGLALLPTSARADELRPAYIEMTEQAPGQWSILWKASANSRLGQTGAVIIPDNCIADGDPRREFAGGNILTRLSLRCKGSVQGQRIGLKNLELSTTDALVRIAPMDSTMQTLRLTPDQPVAALAKPSVISNVAATYTILGFEHILMGFDHLFFVLALVLLLKGGWLVAKTVTAFTVAHSITLAGSTLGLLSLPPQPVEAVIALSIIFLAVEVVKARPDDVRLSERFPWIVAFLFGLLHGFGFAGALAEIGLPEGDVPLALLTFNLGVEIGQLVIVAVALAVLHGLRKMRGHWLQPGKAATAYGIGIIATYWFIERMVA